MFLKCKNEFGSVCVGGAFLYVCVWGGGVGKGAGEEGFWG